MLQGITATGIQREKLPKTWIGESRLQGEGRLDLCLWGVLWLEKGRTAFQVGERRRGKRSLPSWGGVGWQFCLDPSLWYKVIIISIFISFLLRMNVSCITANTVCVLFNPINVWGRYYYYFTTNKWEVHKVSNLPKVTKVVKWQSWYSRTQAVWLQSLCS